MHFDAFLQNLGKNHVSQKRIHNREQTNPQPTTDNRQHIMLILDLD
jgi:hypothetical protein